MLFRSLLALSTTTCNAQAKLFRVVSDIALCFLYERRPQVQANAKPPDSWERAEKWLEDLAQGKRIFGFAQTADAGRIDNSAVTLADLQKRNGVVLQASRLFGVRSDRAAGYQQGTSPGYCGGIWD